MWCVSEGGVGSSVVLCRNGGGTRRSDVGETRAEMAVG